VLGAESQLAANEASVRPTGQRHRVITLAGQRALLETRRGNAGVALAVEGRKRQEDGGSAEGKNESEAGLPWKTRDRAAAGVFQGVIG
jgi:hypothetical protein